MLVGCTNLKWSVVEVTRSRTACVKCEKSKRDKQDTNLLNYCRFLSSDELDGVVG